MKTQIPLSLKPEHREHLESLIRSGNAPARTQTRARILLLSDRSTGECREDAQVASALWCDKTTVGVVRRRFLREGMEAALYDQPRPGRIPKITGEVEAQVPLLACSDAPEGPTRWTRRLLAERVVE